MPKQYTERVLPDGTVLSPEVQTIFESYSQMAHDVGTDIGHYGFVRSEHLLENVKGAGGVLMDFLPIQHVFTATDALDGYVEHGARTHDESPDLCNNCTGQVLAELDKNFTESGLNADLHKVLTR